MVAKEVEVQRRERKKKKKKKKKKKRPMVNWSSAKGKWFDGGMLGLLIKRLQSFFAAVR